MSPSLSLEDEDIEEATEAFFFAGVFFAGVVPFVVFEGVVPFVVFAGVLFADVFLAGVPLAGVFLAAVVFFAGVLRGESEPLDEENEEEPDEYEEE